MDDNMKITWLAGLFEGEGSFYISQGKAKALTISMTDHDVLLRVQEWFGGSIYTLKKREPHWKDAWKWQLGSQAAVDLTARMLPYLGQRRTARGEEFIRLYTGDQEAYRQRRQQETEQRALKALSLRGQGMTHAEIAEILGMERSSVSKILKKYGGRGDFGVSARL